MRKDKDKDKEYRCAGEGQLFENDGQVIKVETGKEVLVVFWPLDGCPRLCNSEGGVECSWEG